MIELLTFKDIPEFNDFFDRNAMLPIRIIDTKFEFDKGEVERIYVIVER